MVFLQKPLDQRFPLRFQIGPVERAAGAAIPIIGIPFDAFLAMKVGVDGHALRGLKGVYKFVGAGPVPFCVPPEGREWNGNTGRRVLLRDRKSTRLNSS